MVNRDASEFSSPPPKSPFPRWILALNDDERAYCIEIHRMWKAGEVDPAWSSHKMHGIVCERLGKQVCSLNPWLDYMGKRGDNGQAKVKRR